MGFPRSEDQSILSSGSGSAQQNKSPPLMMLFVINKEMQSNAKLK